MPGKAGLCTASVGGNNANMGWPAPWRAIAWCCLDYLWSRLHQAAMPWKNALFISLQQKNSVDCGAVRTHLLSAHSQDTCFQLLPLQAGCTHSGAAAIQGIQTTPTLANLASLSSWELCRPALHHWSGHLGVPLLRLPTFVQLHCENIKERNTVQCQGVYSSMIR